MTNPLYIPASVDTDSDTDSDSDSDNDTDSDNDNDNDEHSDCVRSLLWKKNLYDAPTMKLLSESEMLNNITSKIFNEECPKTEEQQQKHNGLKKLMIDFMRQNRGKIDIKLRNFKCSFTFPGLYIVVYDDGTWKIGMSFNMYKRIKKQSFKYVCLVMRSAEVAAFFQNNEPNFVRSIIDLNLDGLNFDPIHDGLYKIPLIEMQTMEALIGCMYECATATLCERLTDLPSDVILDVLQTNTFHDTHSPSFGHIGTKQMRCILSWPTLRAHLFNVIENESPDAFLPQKLGTDRPKDVTIELCKELYDERNRYDGFVDSLETCPRQDEIDTLVVRLRPVLQQLIDIDNKLEDDPNNTTLLADRALQYKAVRLINDRLRGDNRSAYVEPSSIALGMAGQERLQEQIECMPNDHYLTIDRHTINQIAKRETGRKFLQQNCNWDSKQNLFLLIPGLLC